MQDRYAGDIGDYGKFGFLRTLENEGLSIGVNWYLTYPDEKERIRADGKIPITEADYSCDPKLASTLFNISKQDSGRTVEALEQADLLNTAQYFRKPVPQKENRIVWHREALTVLYGKNVIFLDPDNGLLAKSVGENSKRAAKYIIDKELSGYLKQKQAVIFYQHRPRKKQDIYFSDMKERILSECKDYNLQIMALTFRKCSVRDYFILCPDGLFSYPIKKAIDKILSGRWNQLRVEQGL